MESNQDLNILVGEIDDIISAARGRIVELREALKESDALLANREASLAKLEEQNQSSKKEIFNGAPSPEFVAGFENEIADLHLEITETRNIIKSLGDFSTKFEDQLLVLIDLDKKMTEALMAYKFLRS